jgi:hypothetical protein
MKTLIDKGTDQPPFASHIQNYYQMNEYQSSLRPLLLAAFGIGFRAVGLPTMLPFAIDCQQFFFPQQCYHQFPSNPVQKRIELKGRHSRVVSPFNQSVYCTLGQKSAPWLFQSDPVKSAVLRIW